MFDFDGKLEVLVVVDCDPFSPLGVGHDSGKLTVSAVELVVDLGVFGGGPGQSRPSGVLALSPADVGESNPPFRVGLGLTSPTRRLHLPCLIYRLTV